LVHTRIQQRPFFHTRIGSNLAIAKINSLYSKRQ
jgi:hypothetical protein